LYFTTPLWQHNGSQNGPTSRMLFSWLQKSWSIRLVGFMGGVSPNHHLGSASAPAASAKSKFQPIAVTKSN